MSQWFLHLVLRNPQLGIDRWMDGWVDCLIGYMIYLPLGSLTLKKGHYYIFSSLSFRWQPTRIEKHVFCTSGKDTQTSHLGVFKRMASLYLVQFSGHWITHMWKDPVERYHAVTLKRFLPRTGALFWSVNWPKIAQFIRVSFPHSGKWCVFWVTCSALGFCVIKNALQKTHLFCGFPARQADWLKPPNKTRSFPSFQRKTRGGRVGFSGFRTLQPFHPWEISFFLFVKGFIHNHNIYGCFQK